MKTLSGMKKSIASIENKKLKDLQSIQGGLYAIRSNVPCPVETNGESVEYDMYESNGGKYTGRICGQAPAGPSTGTGNWNGGN